MSKIQRKDHIHKEDNILAQKSHDHAIISDLRNGFYQPLGKRERAGVRQLTKKSFPSSLKKYWFIPKAALIP